MSKPLSRRSVLKGAVGTGALLGSGVVLAGRQGGRNVDVAYVEQKKQGVKEGHQFRLIGPPREERVNCENSKSKGHKVMVWETEGTGGWFEVNEPGPDLYVQSKSLSLEEDDIIEVVKSIKDCQESDLENGLAKVQITEVN